MGCNASSMNERRCLLLSVVLLLKFDLSPIVRWGAVCYASQIRSLLTRLVESRKIGETGTLVLQIGERSTRLLDHLVSDLAGVAVEGETLVLG